MVDHDDEDEVFSYKVGVFVDDDVREFTVPETDLFPLPPASNASIDIFKALHWQGPKRFFRRWRLRNLESRWLEDSGGIPSLLGARIHPLGHQIYAVRRILWDRAPRFILADEVGLGKTIEAGLVIQSLMADKPDLRVLVVAPGAMARQWQTELYLRFGALVFKHLDGATWAGLSRAARAALLESPRLVVTTTVLQTDPSLGNALREANWDLVVIDEAHQFPPGSALYGLFHDLARHSPGVLALSATPSKREIASLAGLLALVAPDVYEPDNRQALFERIQVQREVWDKLHLTRSFMDAASDSGEDLEAEDLSYLADEWGEVLPQDEVVSGFLDRLRGGERRAADELVAYVQEYHRLDHRIVRTRRSTLQRENRHWSGRQLEVHRYASSTSEAVLANHVESLPASDRQDAMQAALRGLYLRKFSTTPSHFTAFLTLRSAAISDGRLNDVGLDPIALLTADPGPADEELIIDRIVLGARPLENERAWLDSAIGLARDWQAESGLSGRVHALREWLSTHLAASPAHQVLVFAQDMGVVEELTQILQAELPDYPLRCFHHGMDESDLAQVALQFQRNKACRVLVSDELGGEGRNFQNASALVHFDLPWSVARVEQRVGRLDRVGRGGDRPVLSVVLQGPSAMEAALLDAHGEVFKVLVRSVGGLEYALPHLQLELNHAICEGAEAVFAIRSSLAERVAQELQDVDESFELSLDASRLQLKDAQDLAEMLDEPVDLGQEGTTLTKWAGELGMSTRQLPDQTWKLEWTAEQLRRPLVGIGNSGFVSGTFSRQLALEDERQQFLGPGHPLVDTLMHDLAHSSEGRASVMLVQLGPRYHRRLFALVLGRCDLGLGGTDEADLPQGLRLRARRHIWPEVQPALVELYPGEEPGASMVQDAELTFQLRSPDALKAQYQKLPPNTLGELCDTLKLWGSVREAETLAIEHVRGQRSGIPEQAAKRLEEELRPEIGYLKWRQGCYAPQETDREIEARLRLIEAVRNERVEVEAVAVIVGVR
ncbi:MAG: SNF2-related protein [Chromatiaceae bacterium]|nr:SNF2-related protein [Chromatiaceae bacterium]